MKDSNLENVDKIIQFLKENGIIKKNDFHQYMLSLYSPQTLENENKEANSWIGKAMYCAIALTILSIGLAFLSLWTLIITIPITLVSYLLIMLCAVGGGLSVASGGDTFARIKTIEHYLEFNFNDEFHCLITSSHDYGDTFIFPSKKDFDSIYSKIVPKNETYFRMKKSSMGPNDVSGSEETLEIFVSLECIRLTTVIY